jgi:single-strand DNA-binding protein
LTKKKGGERVINRVILVGRLTKNPEIRKTPNGASICKFTLAVSRKVKAQGQPDADFISCVAWNKTADLMYQYLKKGSLIGVDGRLQTGKFTNNNGETIYTCDVMVESLQFLDKKEEAQNNNVNQEREMSYNEGDYPQW